MTAMIYVFYLQIIIYESDYYYTAAGSLDQD